jgi:phospholipase/carboxylesterase/glyoxalase family protein
MPHSHADQPVVLAGAPARDARCAVIMIHGRNAAPRDILTLVPALDLPDVAYIAPAAAQRTWYPFSFLTETAKNEPYLTSALQRIREIVDDVVSKGPKPAQVVLLGFSQGACLASEFAARHATRYGGVVAFSGGLIGPPGTAWNYEGTFNSMPVFMGCSDVDAHVPKSRVDESAAVFERMGAAVTKRIYPGMGHTVNEDELDAARQLIVHAGDR